MTKVVERVDVEFGTEEVELCRDDRCTILGLHPAHSISARGRVPKSCPICMKPIPRGQGAKCLLCGWSRKRGG